jgi:hypothetical protein
MMRLPACFYALVLAALIAVALPLATAESIAIPERTVRVSVTAENGEADGPSTTPALSAGGTLVVFSTTASNLPGDTNGSTRDVFLRNLETSTTTLISTTAEGAPADGPSVDPSVGGDSWVAFASTATNLVPGDANGLSDVFLRRPSMAPIKVSTPPGGGDANGVSSQPDVSADGRFVVFTSTASNLAPGDTNDTEDVFLYDITAATLTRISGTPAAAANGRSRNPAISRDGTYVTFASTASDLATADTNNGEDVFLYERTTGRIERVSVSSGGTPQNRAVAAPFSQVSDVSDDGRLVVFDSDADNLVARDTNQDTDVFLRDRARGRTVRVSVPNLGRQGDNDSFYPALAGDGTAVVFQSLATNLAPGDHPLEDVFLRDLTTDSTTVVSVGAGGVTRGDERVPQLLQRPSISRDADFVAFTSTADNLVSSADTGGHEDVFLRLTHPPEAYFKRAPRAFERTARPRFELATDDRTATRFVCTIDGKRFPCGATGQTPPVGNGRHVLAVRAGGPGVRLQRTAVEKAFRVSGVKRLPPFLPTARITTPTQGGTFGTTITGRAGGGYGVERVQVLVSQIAGKGRCRFYDGATFVTRSCRRPIYVVVNGTTTWQLQLLRMPPPGDVVVRARAIDTQGQRSVDARRLSRSR